MSGSSHFSRTRVPWSRHETVPRLTSNLTSNIKDTDNQVGCGSKKNRNNGGNNNCAVRTGGKAKSESNVFVGVKTRNSKDENWDSQSDPGTDSPRKWLNSKLNKTEGNAVKRNEHSSNGAKPFKPPIQGRGGRQYMELRRRKGVLPGQGISHANFVMDIPEQVSSFPFVGNETRTLRYVHSYLDFMHYSCVSPHKWSRQEDDGQTKCQYSLGYIKKFIFCYFVALATLYSFNAIKYSVLEFLTERNLNNFIDIGYFLTSGFLHIYIAYFITCSRREISGILKMWDQYEHTATNEPSDSASRVEWLPIVNGIATLIIAALKTVTVHESYETMILDQSVDTAEVLFVWTPTHWLNRTSINDLYGTDLSAMTYTLGSIGILSEFSWELLLDCFKDLVFWVAKVNEQQVAAFGRAIKENLLMKSTTGKNSDTTDDNCWRKYRRLLGVNLSTNSTFYTLLVMCHLDTFLTFSYFLTQVLNEKAKPIDMVIIGYDVLKGIILYLPARRSSLENDRCIKWIQSLPCDTKRFRVGDTVYTRDVMLSELKEDPLGLGSGKVHINNEFIVTFISLVASLFCFLLNLDTKNKEVARH